MATLKFTIIGRYEAEDEQYPEAEGSPRKMAEIDQEQVDNADVSIFDVIEWANDRDLEVRIEAEE